MFVRRYFNNFPEPSVLSPDVLLPSAAAMEVEDGELMYLELQVTITRAVIYFSFTCRYFSSIRKYSTSPFVVLLCLCVRVFLNICLLLTAIVRQWYSA